MKRSVTGKPILANIWVVGLCGVLWANIAGAQAMVKGFTLKETIHHALKVNLDLEISQEEIVARDLVKKAWRADYLPLLDTTYQYKHLYEEQKQTIELNGSPTTVGLAPQGQYSLMISVTQPIFTGFATSNQYKLAELGLI